MSFPRSILFGTGAFCALSLLPAWGQKDLDPQAAKTRQIIGAPSSGGWLGGSDDCSTATPIVGTGTFNFDTSAATTGTEGQVEPLCGMTGAIGIDLDVWYLWTAPADGTATISTCDAGTMLDTKIAVYDGSSCPLDGTALTCNDDVCDVQTVVAWTAVAGQDYMIQFGAFPGAAGGTGTFELELGQTGGTQGTYNAGTAGSPPIAPDPTTQGWTDIDPSNGQIDATDVSPDGATGLNAWQVDDDQSNGNSWRLYEALFGPEAIAVGRHAGWKLSTSMRVVQAPSFSLFMEYSTGTGTVDQRYHVWFQESGSDLLARILGPNSVTYTCVGAMDGNYHEFTLEKAPGQDIETAEFIYDGVVLGPAVAATGSGTSANGGAQWGSANNNGTGTANWNEVRFELGGSVTGSPFCFGDGVGSTCPCGNESVAGRGCQNSTGLGAVLNAGGSNSVSSDDMTFSGSTLLPNQPALLFVGQNAINGGNGIFFGDGLRCAGMNVVRLGVDIPGAGGNASWGPGLANQGGWTPGDQRFFQIWYRDPSGGPCGTGFNLSNGFDVTFGF